MCNSTQFKCVKDIDIDKHNCIPPCEGQIVTSFVKNVYDENLEKLLKRFQVDLNIKSINEFEILSPAEISSYNHYTKWFAFPSDMQGKKSVLVKSVLCDLNFQYIFRL